jgi:diketogulonate reductase-like aldo/keto reductase
MEEVDAVVAVLRSIGDAHDRTPSQVALNWLILKGSIPIPGAKNRKQAEENAGALGWSLTPDEVSALDDVAMEEKRSLQSRFWQHG